MQLLIAAAALMIASTSPAAADRPRAEIAERVRELAQWIVDNSDYETLPEAEPVYVFLPGAEIRRLATGGVPEPIEPEKGFVFRAVYRDGVMYLRDDIDPDADAQVLLHELVHHFQWASGREYRCNRKREVEAYDLQRRFAEAVGEEPRVPNALAMVWLSTC